MAVLRQDGFEGYGGAIGLAQGYPLAASATIQPTGGADGGACLQFSGGELRYGPPGGTKQLIIGYRSKNGMQLDLRNAVNPVGYITLGVDGIGRVFGQKASLFDYFFQTDPGMRLRGVWRYYEFDFKLHPTDGHIIVRVDEQEIVNLTSQVTQVGSAPFDLTKMILSSGDSLLDDLIIMDDTVGPGPNPCNSFQGDRVMAALFPNGDVSANYTRDSGSTNYSRVDDPTNDDDASYVASDVLNTEDEYNVEDTGLPASQPVLAQVMLSARRASGTGPRGVTPFIKVGGTRVNGSEMALSSTYYTHDGLVLTRNPATGLVLTAAAIDAATMGHKVTT